MAAISYLFIFLLLKSIKLISSIPASPPRMQACGTDLKYLINYMCTYKDEKLPCFTHFLGEEEKNIKKENPLEIIEAMKQRALRENFADGNEASSFANPKPLNNQTMTLVEECCYDGCSINEVKTKYCCFTEQCLDLCYPGDFDVFRV